MWRLSLGLHIVCDFRFDTYHDTFFWFSIRINDTNLLGNSWWTVVYCPVHPKMWSAFTLNSSQIYQKSNMGGILLSKTNIFCIFPWELVKKNQNHQKWDVIFTSTSFQSKWKSNMGEVLLKNTNVLCIFAPELAKKQLKSSKTRRVWVVNDTNDTFSIRFGYQTI